MSYSVRGNPALKSGENVMNLPKLKDLDVSGKNVIVRGDLDVGPDTKIGTERLKAMIPTLTYLAEKKAKIVILGHRGRPDGVEDENLSLKPVSKKLEELLSGELGQEKMKALDIQVMENLRFTSGEEENDKEYAELIALEGNLYVNEAFSASHREHASIVALPRHLKSKSKNSVAAGFHFVKEVENLEKVIQNPQKPIVAIISGLKEDKLTQVIALKKFADKILIGGRLPEYIHDSSPLRKDPKVIIANLIVDKEDISFHSIESFEKEIKTAGTIILAGPVGKFEDEGHMQGTKKVFKAVASSSAYKVAGGGETEQVIRALNLAKEFDWISVGGGAMLTFLSNGTLPGIQALIN